MNILEGFEFVSQNKNTANNERSETRPPRIPRKLMMLNRDKILVGWINIFAFTNFVFCFRF